MELDLIRKSEPELLLPYILTIFFILLQIDYTPLLNTRLETPNVLVSRSSQVENLSYRFFVSIELSTRFAKGEAALGSGARVPDELFRFGF